MTFPVGQIPRYLAGFASMGVCTYFLATKWDHPTIFLSSSFLLLICITDTFFSRIPNLLTVALLMFGSAYHTYQLGIDGLTHAGLGFLTGLGLLLIPYLLGGMAAGDVKALAALGAVLGPKAIFQVFLYTGLIGGVLALLFASFNASQRARARDLLNRTKNVLITRDVKLLTSSTEKAEEAGMKLSFPYATAIAFGFFSFVQWGRLI
jgi:prepilin peptidase CpaA